MDYEDRFDPRMPNDLDADADAGFHGIKSTQNGVLLDVMRIDKGLNFIQTKIQTASGRVKTKKMKVYTSGGIGAHIRDAETGEFYPNIVGSKDEYLFYKVMFANGECNSANGSSTAFFCSPHHYMDYLKTTVSPEKVAAWEAARDDRLKERELVPNKNVTATLVK